MIARITFEKDEKDNPCIMLFGNSYKKWQTQLIEYLGRYYCSKERGWTLDQMVNHIIKVEISKSSWKGWGGLKWCSDDNFQLELNREGCQSDEPDNPSPRKYSEMEFVNKPVNYAEKYIYKEFN